MSSSLSPLPVRQQSPPARGSRLLSLGLPLALAGTAFAASLLALPHLPERIPTHWGLQGEATNLLPSGVAAFILPGMMVWLWVLLGASGWSLRHTPEGRELPAWIIPAVLAGTLGLLLLLHLALLASGIGWKIGIPFVASAGTGLFFIGLGVLMKRTPPNPVLGVRTSATLGDEHAWRVANRAGGRALILAGFASVAASPLPLPWPLAVLLSATILASVAAILAGRRAGRSVAQT